jgi:predicted TIM-barrel fold metal-dependent hydrolase
MNKNINRRKFIKETAVTATTVTMANSLMGFPAENGLRDKASLASTDIMLEVKKYRKMDAYATSDLSAGSLSSNLDFADRFSIEKLFVAMPMTEIKATPEEFKSKNDLVYKAVRQHPDKLVGQFTFNPRYQRESLEEIKRSVDRGMVGSRIYHQVKINDPLFFPVIERFIDLKMILFAHGEVQLGVGGYRMKYDAGKSPTINLPEDFVDVAIRYPEAMFQFPHIGGGGDWEYMCKAFKNYPNIYVDAGGSNNQENMIDFAVELLGEDRVFFGSDNSFYQGVGKVLSSNLSDKQRRKIFFENYNNVLKKGGYHFS